MRLSAHEVSGFIDVLSDFLKGEEAELFLYGSRTNDLLKGGDIDLLLVLSETRSSEALTQQKAEILNSFKKKLGDRRIDLSILSDEQAQSDSFFKGILPTAISIRKFQKLPATSIG